MPYTIEGKGESGERGLIGIAESPADALQLARGVEKQGLSQVAIISAIGWEYSIAEFAAVTGWFAYRAGR